MGVVNYNVDDNEIEAQSHYKRVRKKRILLTIASCFINEPTEYA